MARLKVKKTILMESIGRKISIQRKIFKISAKQLGAKIGISSQQIYKYECGSDRISCDMIVRIAFILKVPVMYFFENIETQYTPEELYLEKQSLEIAHNFKLIKSAGSRHAASQNIKILAENK